LALRASRREGGPGGPAFSAASPRGSEHAAALAAIVAKIEAGEDLSVHLSKAVEENRGLDRMLADVGVHHLHISDALGPGGLHVVRGNDLLFVAFKPDDAYLIGIYEHKTDWARMSIVETMARNWPDTGLVHELSYVIAPTQDWSNEERLELQRAGFAGSPVVVDGKVFMTVGQSFGGTPYSAARLSMVVMHTFREWREELEARLADAERAIDEAAGKPVRGEWEPDGARRVGGVRARAMRSSGSSSFERDDYAGSSSSSDFEPSK
jgi:hypothetical protein